MKSEIIFDAEFDGLNPTKIWCFSYENLTTGEQHTTQDYNEIRKILQDTGSYFIGHNITRFDVVHLGRILEIDLSHLNLIDTLPLSWYLWPERHKHGIEEWGDYFGLKKPQVDDWFNLDIEVYKHRCREDVIINRHFWQLVKDKLFLIYKDSKSAFELIKYLQFKMNCAQLQEENRWKLDVPKTQKSLEALKKIKDEKVKSLGKALPKVPKYAKRFRPRVYYSKSGDRTKRALEWEELLKELGLDVETTEEVEVIVDWMEPNPSSHSQLKGWLFSLGWEPCTYKQNKKKEEIPQITKEGSSDLVPSVLKLKEKAPSIVELQGLFTINHRIGILEGFLASMDEEGFVRAKIAGLTNTLRFKHSEIVNLPGVDRPYGAYIRPCLIAEDGWELCGADMASLEDRTKQHYLWDWDPEYVTEMNKPGWDPHLDIALLGGMMTNDEVELYKKDPDNPPKDLKAKRHGAKTTNYSCTYGAYPPKIARTANISIEEARVLWETYWKRNWSIKKVAESISVQEVDWQGEKEMWLHNPVNGFWYSLRNEKDIFSTLNQGTGAYVFDVWIGFVLSKRKQLTAQFHDEGVWQVRKGHRKEFEELLLESIKETNQYLKLNRQLDIGIHWGNNYGDIH